MPNRWEQREKKLAKRRSFIADNRRSVFLEVDMRNRRDSMLEERAKKRKERNERRAIHRQST